MIILKGKFKWQDIADANSLHLDLDSLQRQVKETKKEITAKNIYTSLFSVFAISFFALQTFLVYGALTITLIILSPIFILVILLVIIALCLLCTLLFKSLVRRNARRQFSQNKFFQFEHESAISSTILEASYRSETIDGGTTRYLLSDFYKYKANKDIIIIYQSKELYSMFPRRFFASEEDFKTCISYLEANFPTPKR